MISFAQYLIDSFSSNPTGVAANAAQANMSANHIFNPIIFDATENAAFNASEASWTLAEMATHYVVLPAIMASLAYASANYMLGNNQKPEHAVVQRPEAPRGFLGSMWDKAKSAATKFGAYIALPEGASYVTHQLWSKKYLWDKYRLYGTSFMRPFFERLLPTIYDYWDKGDLNFSLRDLVPSWQTLNPAYAVRGFFNIFRSQATKDAEVFARSYYEWGQSVSEYLAEDAKYAFRFLNGIYESPECFRKGEAFQQCLADTANFTSEVANSSPILTTIKSTVGAAFDSWRQYLIDNGMSGIVSAGRYGNEALWGVANFTESKTGIPAAFVYSAEWYMLYRLGRLASSLAVAKLHSAWIAGPGAVQNNHVVVNRGGRDERQPQDPQGLGLQPGVVHGGAANPVTTASPVTTVSPHVAPHMQPQAQVYIVNGPQGMAHAREHQGVRVEELNPGVPDLPRREILALQ